MANETFDLGGGKLYFSEENEDGSFQPFGYWGRTDDDLSLTIDVETLEHENTEDATTEVDFEIETKKTIGGNITTDEMSQKMVGRFFRGTVNTTAQTSGSLVAAAIGPVNEGGLYELDFIAFTDGTVVVKDVTDLTTYTEGTDYSVDLGAGTIEILAGTTIPADAVLHVSGDYAAVSFDTVEVGTKTKLTGKFKFISDQSTGIRKKVTMHKTSVIPSGDFALKGTKDWKKISFSLKVLKDETITTNGISKYMKIEEIV